MVKKFFKGLAVTGIIVGTGTMIQAEAEAEASEIKEVESLGYIDISEFANVSITQTTAMFNTPGGTAIRTLQRGMSVQVLGLVSHNGEG